MATIGNLAVKITASTGQFSKGIQTAESGIKSLAVTAIAATAIVTALVTAGAGLAIGFAHLYSRATENVVAVNRLSDRFGVTTEAMVGLQLAGERVGVTTEQMSAGFNTLDHLLGEVEAGSSTASSALLNLGLNGRSLARGGLDSAFAQISDRLLAIPDPTRRAAAAVRVFGNETAAILPLLGQGSSGIDAARASAERLGLTFSRIDGANVEAANNSMRELSKILEGVGRQFAVGIAPYVSGLLIELRSVTPSMSGIAESVLNIAEGIGTGVGALTDFWRDLRIVFEGTIMSIQRGIIGLLELIKQALQAGSSLPGVGDSMREAAEGVAEGITLANTRLAEMQGNINQIIMEGSSAQRVRDFFARVRANADQMARELENGQRQGGTANRTNRLANIFQEANQIISASRSPFQAYEDTLARLSFLLDNGALSWDQYAQAVSRAAVQLESANNIQLRHAGAAEQGTQAAQSAINRYSLGESRNGASPQERMLRAVEEGQLIARQQLEVQRQIATALTGRGGAPAGVGGAAPVDMNQAIRNLPPVIRGILREFGGIGRNAVDF